MPTGNQKSRTGFQWEAYQGRMELWGHWDNGSVKHSKRGCDVGMLLHKNQPDH